MTRIKYELYLSFVFICAVFLFLVEFFIIRTPFYPGGVGVNGDGRIYYAIARSIVIDRNLDLYNEFIFKDVYKHPPIRHEGDTSTITPPIKLGTAILEVPFVFFAHVSIDAINFVFKKNYPKDGYSAPYQLFTCLGNMFCGFLGIFLIYRAGTRYFRREEMFFALLFMILASPVILYLIYENATYHMASLFSIGLFIYALFKCRENGYANIFSNVLLGFSIGAVFIVRYHDSVFFLLFIKEIVEFSRNTLSKARVGAKNIIIVVAILLLIIVPQALLWNFYGTFKTAKMVDFLFPIKDLFQKTYILELLFSTNHGLFTSHPVFLIALAGIILFYKRIKDKFVWIPLVAVLCIEIYYNSVARDWMAGDSFGARRLISCVPIFLFGLANIMMILKSKLQKGVAYSALVFLTLFNLLFMQQWVTNSIPHIGKLTAKQIFADKIDFLVRDVKFITFSDLRKGVIRLLPYQIDKDKYNNWTVDYMGVSESVIDVSKLHFLSLFFNEIENVEVRARGTNGDGVWPNMNVSTGDWNTDVTIDSAGWKDYVVEINGNLAETDFVKIRFTNDYYNPEKGEDRNIFVSGLKIRLGK